MQNIYEDTVNYHQGEDLQFCLQWEKGQNPGDESFLTPPPLQPLTEGSCPLLPVPESPARAEYVLHLPLLPGAAVDAAGQTLAQKEWVQIFRE